MEQVYERKLVDKSKISFLSFQPIFKNNNTAFEQLKTEILSSDADVWIYVLEKEKQQQPSNEKPICFSYLDVILMGIFFQSCLIFLFKIF